MKIQDKYQNIENKRILELKEKINIKEITNAGFISSVFRIENLWCGWLKGVSEKKKETPYDFIPKNDLWGLKTAKIEQIYMMLQSNAIQNDKEIVCPSLEAMALITNSTVQWIAKVQKRLSKNGLIHFARKAKNSLKYFSLKINQLKKLLSIAKEKLESATNNEKATSFREYFRRFSHSLNRFMKKSQIKNDNYIDYILIGTNQDHKQAKYLKTIDKDSNHSSSDDGWPLNW